MSRQDSDYLYDIQQAIERIQSYASGLSYEQFLDDIKTQDAVIRNLQVMGEAVRKLSGSLIERYPEIPWREIAGLRNRIVHDYFGINFEIIWTVVQVEIPHLSHQITRVQRQID
jgi:uncharacterized protein with HEPN domain